MTNLNEIIIPLTIMAAYKIYNRFFSKAAKACKSKKGIDGSICRTKFMLAATIKGRQELIKNKSKAEDKEKFNKHINKWDKKVNKLRIKLNKLQLKKD